ncbi:putative nudix hydrolase 15, mitochondrial [Cocos nucifera]|nr:putative nudix hydrolase 15, mitochondrial [Cocos nucifera]
MIFVQKKAETSNLEMKTIVRSVSAMGSPPSPKNNNMMVPNLIGSGSQSLNNLVQQLRLYKPPPSPADTDDDDTAVDARGKVFSGMGLAESAVPSALLYNY